MTAKITGLEIVRNNLNEQIIKIKGGSMKGLIESAIIIRRDMEMTPPKIPIDTGNLRASWHADGVYINKKPVMIMGFTANYAAAVHEKVDAHFKRPGSGAKFLESSLKRNTDLIVKTVQNNAKVE